MSVLDFGEVHSEIDSRAGQGRSEEAEHSCHQSSSWEKPKELWIVKKKNIRIEMKKKNLEMGRDATQEIQELKKNI